MLKQVVAEFDAGELITMREQVLCLTPSILFLTDAGFKVSARTNQELVTRASQFGLILDDISITHLTFGRY